MQHGTQKEQQFITGKAQHQASKKDSLPRGSFTARAAKQDNNFCKFCSKGLISEISQLEQSAKYLM